MRINNNIPALNAHRLLSANNSLAAKNLEKLSSGKRINRAADDSAGMAISEKMNAQIRGLKMASKNSLDGISLVQTAEGAMNEIHSMLQRMRELSVQAANGTMDVKDRDAIQSEINQLTSEVNRIGNGTEFNKMNILKGNGVPKSNTQYATMSTGKPAEYNLDYAFDACLETEVVTGVKQVIDFGETLSTFTADTVSVKYAWSGAATDATAALAGNVVTITLGTGAANNTAAKIQSALNGVFLGGKGIDQTKIKVTGDIGAMATNTLTTSASTGSLILGGTGVTTDPFRGVNETDTLVVTINGKENVVNLQGFSRSTNLTYEDFLERINDALGDEGRAFFNDSKKGIVIRTNDTGGNRSIKFEGTALSKITSTTTEKFGTAENPANFSTGYFKFDSIPEKGSSIRIGDKFVDFYDSTKEPYLGNNIPVNVSGKTVEQLVAEVSNLAIAGVSMFVGNNTAGKNLPSPLPAGYPSGFNNNNSKELIVVSHERGFGGNTIPLEGTLEDFNVNLQVGANAGQGFRMEIGDIRSLKLRISADKPTGNPGAKGAAYTSIKSVTNGIDPNLEEYAVDVTDEKKATAAIEVYNNAIIKLAEERSRLGATQNRLEKTVNNLDNTSENLTAALSRIVDTDMALEMSNFTKMNVLQQAGTSMLAQANQQPQMILKLLNA